MSWTPIYATGERQRDRQTQQSHNWNTVGHALWGNSLGWPPGLWSTSQFKASLAYSRPQVTFWPVTFSSCLGFSSCHSAVKMVLFKHELPFLGSYCLSLPGSYIEQISHLLVNVLKGYWPPPGSVLGSDRVFRLRVPCDSSVQTLVTDGVCTRVCMGQGFTFTQSESRQEPDVTTSAALWLLSHLAERTAFSCCPAQIAPSLSAILSHA